MKPYPPVLKEKMRYLSFKVHAKMTFTENQVKHSLVDAVLTLLGEAGSAKASFKIVEYDEALMSGVIRTTNEMLDELMFALTLIKDVQGKNAWCEILGTSGTIKTCQEKHAYKPGEQDQESAEEPEELVKKPSEIMKYAKS